MLSDIWWYYTVEREDGGFYKGVYADDMILLPRANLAKIEKASGQKFGDPNNPLLVACRSGAKMSMPGMMDTVLNIGLNDEVV